MQGALKLLKQHSEKQEFLLYQQNMAPFTQFRYSVQNTESVSSSWSARLLPGYNTFSSCYILRQRNATVLLNPCFETLKENYSPTLQNELESCQLLILPTPKKVIGLYLKLEQIQQNLFQQQEKQTKLSQNKVKKLERKKQLFQQQLHTVWATFAQNICTTFDFIRAKQQSPAKKLQVYCSEPVVFNLYNYLTDNQIQPYHNSELAGALHYLHKNFDFLQFHSLYTLRYQDEQNTDTLNISEITQNTTENLSKMQSSHSFQWRGWNFALVLEPNRWGGIYYSKICAYLENEQLFINIELNRSKDKYLYIPKKIQSKLEPKFTSWVKNKHDFVATQTSRLLGLQPFLLPDNGELPKSIGLCQFRCIRSTFIRKFFSPFAKRIYQRANKHAWNNSQSKRFLPLSLIVSTSTKQPSQFILQGQFVWLQSGSQNATPLKFDSASLQTISLQYQGGIQGAWPKEKSLWQNLQQTAANIAQIATTQQKSFCLLVEREATYFLSHTGLLEEEQENTQFTKPWRKGFHSKTTMQQPLSLNAKFFWSEFFQHSKHSSFPAILLWHLWSHLEPAIAKKIQRKRKIAQFLRSQQPDFERLLQLFGIECQWSTRPIMYYKPSLKTLAELLRLPKVLLGNNKIEGAQAWRKFWLNIHKEHPVTVKQTKIYYYWPNWHEKLEQLAGACNEQLLENLKQRLQKETMAYLRVYNLETQLRKFQQRCQRDKHFAEELLNYQQVQQHRSKLIWQFIRRSWQPYFVLWTNKASHLKTKIRGTWLITTEIMTSLQLWHVVANIYRNILHIMSAMTKRVVQNYQVRQGLAKQAKLQKLQKYTVQTEVKRQAKAEAIREQEAFIAARHEHRTPKQEAAITRRMARQEHQMIIQQQRQKKAAARINQKTLQLRERTMAQQRRKARQTTARVHNMQRLRSQRQEHLQLLWAHWNDRYEIILSPFKKRTRSWLKFYRNHRTIAVTAISTISFALVAIFFVPNEIYNDLWRAVWKVTPNALENVWKMPTNIEQKSSTQFLVINQSKQDNPKIQPEKEQKSVKQKNIAKLQNTKPTKNPSRENISSSALSRAVAPLQETTIISKQTPSPENITASKPIDKATNATTVTPPNDSTNQVAPSVNKKTTTEIILEPLNESQQKNTKQQVFNKPLIGQTSELAKKTEQEQQANELSQQPIESTQNDESEKNSQTNKTEQANTQVLEKTTESTENEEKTSNIKNESSTSTEKNTESTTDNPQPTNSNSPIEKPNKNPSQTNQTDNNQPQTEKNIEQPQTTNPSQPVEQSNQENLQQQAAPINTAPSETEKNASPKAIVPEDKPTDEDKENADSNTEPQNLENRQNSPNDSQDATSEKTKDKN